MLEVVEHEQQLAVVNETLESILRSQATRLLHPERLGNGRDHQRWLGDASQTNEEDAVGEVVEQIGGSLQREPRLARAPGARHGDETNVRTAEELTDVRQLLLASD